MIVIVPKKVYKEDDPFPMIALPSNIADEGVWQDFQLDDFQWWAKTDDFDKWFKTSGRSWKADESEDFSQFSSVLDENNNVLSFDQFIHANSHLLDESEYYLVNEEGEGDESGTDVPRYNITEKQTIKFMFAYQKLLAEGKIDLDYDMAGFPMGDDKCIFLSNGSDDQNPEIETLTTAGFRFVGKSNLGTGILMEYDKSYPGPVDIKGDDPLMVANRKLATLTESQTTSGESYMQYIYGAGAIFVGVVAFKGLYNYKKVLSTINFFKTAKDAAKIIDNANDVNKAVKTGRGLGLLKGLGKGFSRFYNNFLRYPDRFIKAGASWASTTIKGLRKLEAGAKEISAVTKVGRVIRSFFRGGAIVAGKQAGAVGKVTNPLGWILLGVDGVGSLLNWYSSNQAPTHSEGEDLFQAKDEFSPGNIEVGENITLCWSQESTSAWGAVLSFLVTNIGETRTILNMTKILDDIGGNSIFLINSANSESLNKQIQENLMTVIALPNSKIIKQGFFDNDEIEGKIASVPHDNGAEPSPWFFKGICDWGEIESAVGKAEDRFFKVDTRAPETYAWNFRDVDGDIVNVTGKLVKDEDLDKFSAKELMDLFHGGRIVNPENTDTGKGSQESSGGIDTLDASAENEGDKEGKQVDENFYVSRVIENFSDYDPELDFVNEDIEGLSVDPNKLSEPVLIALYICQAEGRKQYASKDVADRKNPPKFTNFVVDPADYDAEKGEPIEVVTNTDEIIMKPKRGLVVVKETGGDEDSGGRQTQKPERDDDQESEKRDDQGDEETDKEVRGAGKKILAKGMVMKLRDRSVVIRDKEKSGPTLIKEFLDDQDKKILDIQDWNRVTFIKMRKNKSGEPYEIILRNSDADFTDRARIYDKDSGESFEIAKKFVETCVDRLEFNED